MNFPVGAVLWSALGAAALVRTFYHPYRGVVANGYAARCAGDAGCGDSSMLITSAGGALPVYAVASGRVLEAGAARVVIAASRAPVVLVYTGVVPQVAASGQVGAGEQIGTGRDVGFAVYAIDASGRASALEPATWLAARGLRVSQKTARGTLWCDQGRKLRVPSAVASCGIGVPAPSGFMLLPVSSTTV